jgi:hypothetical protein
MVRSSTGVATEYGRLDGRRRRVQRPQIDAHCVAADDRDVAGGRGELLESLHELRVELDHVNVGDAVGDPLRQRPLPTADLQGDVVGLELGVAHDRVEQVLVGEEMLPQPHHRKILSALASTLRSSSA